MSKAIGFYKQDGKTKPITPRQSNYDGQTEEVSWNQGSSKYLAEATKKEHREHPWTTQAQARAIAVDHQKVQAKEVEPIITSELSEKPTRKEVMESEEFRTWWNNRKKTQPVPSDPYRAFMIDRSLEAKLTSQGTWSKEPNRMDFEPIDFPPIVKGRRLRRPEPEPKGPYVEETKKKLKAQELEMAKGMNVSPPELRFTQGSGRSFYASGYGKNKQTGEIVKIQEPYIMIGLRKDGKMAFTDEGTLAHELGHHKKVVELEREGGKEAVYRFYYNLQNSRERLNEAEREAWKNADPYMTNKRAVQKWHKKYALGTYLGTTPPRTHN
jgi:hypothetical protein